jgi:cell shape-determining protein MreC
VSDLECFTPEELAVIATLLGIAPARTFSINELNVLGNFVTAVGCVMLAIAAQAQFLDSLKEKENEDTDIKKQIQELREQLKKLEEQQNKLISSENKSRR